MSALKMEIGQTIAAIEEKMQLFKSLRDALQSVSDRLEELPPGLAEMLFGPLRSKAEELVGNPSHDENVESSLDENAGQGECIAPSPEVFARFKWTAFRKKGQFSKMCGYFFNNGNKASSIEKIGRAIMASKGAIANILYRTHREAFISEPAHGHRRLRLWKLQPGFFRDLTVELEGESNPWQVDRLPVENGNK